jgi:hypothetical protein
VVAHTDDAVRTELGPVQTELDTGTSVHEQRERTARDIKHVCYVETPREHSAESLPNDDDDTWEEFWPWVTGLVAKHAEHQQDTKPTRKRPTRLSGLTKKENLHAMRFRTAKGAPEPPGRL